MDSNHRYPPNFLAARSLELADARRQRAVPPRHRDERGRDSDGGTRTRDKARRGFLAELGLKANQVDQLQALPFECLLATIDLAQKKLPPPGFQLLDRYGFRPGGGRP